MRLKKLYSIKESTAEYIKAKSIQLELNESYTLDFIIEEYQRMKTSKTKEPQEYKNTSKILEGLKEKWTKKQEK